MSHVDYSFLERKAQRERARIGHEKSTPPQIRSLIGRFASALKERLVALRDSDEFPGFRFHNLGIAARQEEDNGRKSVFAYLSSTSETGAMVIRIDCASATPGHARMFLLNDMDAETKIVSGAPFSAIVGDSVISVEGSVADTEWFVNAVCENIAIRERRVAGVAARM